jgi:polyisoprenoid-binding protein YceI
VSAGRREARGLSPAETQHYGDGQEAGDRVADRETFRLVGEHSAVLVGAQSSAGPITFGTMTLDGHAEFAMPEIDLDSAVPLVAVMRIPVLSLESGNKLYDSELQRRLDQRRFPNITVEMCAAIPRGGGRFATEGDLTISGTTRRMMGFLDLAMPDENTLIATGGENVDMQEFGIDLPSILAFKIYPEVNVQFRLTATRARPDNSRRRERGDPSSILRRLADLRPGRSDRGRGR